MRAYRYSAFTGGGKPKTGTVIADSESHAAELLLAQGLYAATIEAKPATTRRRGRGRLDADLRAVFARQMAVLLGAGLPAEAALEAVRGSGGGALETVAAEVKAAVLDGEPLSAALERGQAGFPAYVTAAIRAGEVSGDLAAVFEELARHLERAGSDRAQIAAALVYPAFVFTVSLLVCGVLMVNVAPEIVAMFEVTGKPLPGITAAMLGVTDWIVAHWLALGLGAAALVAGLALAWRRPGFRDRCDRAVLRLPVIGRLVRLAQAAQYLRTLALVIASRQTVLDAVGSAAEVLTIARFRAESEAVREAVTSGESLSKALARMTLIPPVALQLVAAGEQSARLAPLTERAAALVETWLVNERKRLTALIDPILMMLIGAFVLVIVLAILLPIFELQAVIGQ